jgi:mannose-6-phosphate isomerase-like protein (cupin superfamily)
MSNVREHDVKMEVLSGTKGTVRRLDDQEEWRSICGMRRDLLAGAEQGPARIHYMRIGDSRKHWHKHTTEYYFVTEGRGEIELDDEVVPIAKGDLAVVPPGVWHTSRPAPGEEVHVLLVVVPQPGPGGEFEHQADEHFE